MELIPSLRVSVWSACDLTCSYCHREGNQHPGRHLTDGEMLTLVRAALPLGLRKVKVTGGEPLLRPNLPPLLREMFSWGLWLSLTTNGLALGPLAMDMKESGLAKLNVSLDTLNSERFRDLTGADSLPRVLEGIRAAQVAGLSLELDAVVLGQINEDEVPQLIAFAGQVGARMQFIELSPAGIPAEFYTRHHRDLDLLEGWLSRQGVALEGAASRFDRPRYRVDGVEVSLCSVVRDPGKGRRRQGLRLAADGKVYGFAYGESPRADLAAALRAGAREDELTALWEAASHAGQEVNTVK